jgi:NAD(P)-dependent dehydrogenase (short-subunit alcohol dehydrogenase family)
MRWLTHGSSLAPAVAEALVRHGHKVVTAAEINLELDASPDEVLEAAHKAQLDVLTTDGVLADTPFASPSPFDRTIVYLQLEGGEVEQDDAVDRLFERYKRLSPGRIYTVTGTRVKIRQLPGTR